MTRSPLSASISRTVNTVSYSIEFPTFLVESVLVATFAKSEDIALRSAHLRQNIIHRLARCCISSSQKPQKSQHLRLQKGIGDAAHVVFGAEAGGRKRLEMLD